MEKVKIYYGLNYEESRAMFAVITGEMCDGRKVYTECNENGELINTDKQYIRTLKWGTQLYTYL